MINLILNGNTKFIREMPSSSLFPGWDVPYGDSNTYPRYVISWLETEGIDPIIPEMLKAFDHFEYDSISKKISIDVSKNSTFRKSFSGELFSTDYAIRRFKEIFLDSNRNITGLSEFIFDPARTALNNDFKEDLFRFGKYTLIAGGCYFVYKKAINQKRKS
ncbi:hypothetical protein [Leptospira ilyithenensis]|uniref:Uncharacterized protein n=1 Tax=Leptospira ilyithenensis TaxID=2484901 RepID=A0A4R9LMH4_9LEPT|nr:hypothetical protein [Leptospira ilyithenensis]TGN09761.1 hypothetical protein EHS11_11810 [Leptospira ilyithenensis]